MSSFVDRRDAGRQLAARLMGSVGERAVVLGLPRGGVPVGFEIAQALNLPLDVWVVRKIGAPGNPELGVGAVAEGGFTYVNRDLVAALGLPPAELTSLIDFTQQELAERVRLLRPDAVAPTLSGRDVVVVDDGVATGGTLLVALYSIGAQAPRTVTVAVPVGVAEVLAQLSNHADRVVCLLQPEDLRAVGLWYDDFAAVADGDVRDLLREVKNNSKY